MPEQKWYCETCDKTGTVKYDKHADAWSVIMDIADNHRKISPDCVVEYREIRVINDVKGGNLEKIVT